MVNSHINKDLKKCTGHGILHTTGLDLEARPLRRIGLSNRYDNRFELKAIILKFLDF